jgi:hypothetical protein
MNSSRPLYVLFWIALTTFCITIVVSDLIKNPIVIPRSEVPLPADDALTIEGWRGPAAQIAEGIHLVLAPLHVNAERQAFDAQALAARLNLPDGEPWRLEVRGPDAAALKALLDAQQAGNLSVRDASGVASSLIGSAVDAKQVEPSARPILNLLTPGELEVENEQIVGRWVLWGRRPLEACQLVLSGQEWSLTPASLGREEIPRYVASRNP